MPIFSLDLRAQPFCLAYAVPLDAPPGDCSLRISVKPARFHKYRAGRVLIPANYGLEYFVAYLNDGCISDENRRQAIVLQFALYPQAGRYGREVGKYA